MTLLMFCSCANQQDPLLSTMDFVKEEVDLLQTGIDRMRAQCENENFTELQQEFKTARLHYKRAEFLIEYYFPPTAELLNGPAIDETEEYDDKVNYATGFQVVEEYIFPDVDISAKEDLIKEIKIMQTSVRGLHRSLARVELTDANVIEAIRLEVLRLMSLGISGFDSPIATHSLPEATAALDGIQTALSYYKHRVPNGSEKAVEDLNDQFESAKKYISEHSNFNSFDRAEFLVAHLNVLTNTIFEYQKTIGIPNNNFITALNLEKNSFFDPELFRDIYFGPIYHTEKNEELINLGKILFFDPVLSGNNSRSCASCHNPAKAFTDGRVKSVAFDSDGEVLRNAPSLINSSFQRAQFYDSRVTYLEDQITEVMASTNELHGNINEASEKIKKSHEYVSLFEQAFNVSDAVTNKNIQIALASYIRSLRSFNSPFDRYMRGDHTAMSGEEITGFNLFMGKGKCATCHFMPLFNGTVPPAYTKSESEILGVPAKADTLDADVDRDLGKYHTYKRSLHKNAFKTPTVRNAALTAPYMHNGVYSTLEEVVDFYNRGGGAGIGIKLENQTLPPDKLNLTKLEKKQIIAFINSLTDTTKLTSTPQHLPKFGDVKLDKRKIGGVY